VILFILSRFPGKLAHVPSGIYEFCHSWLTSTQLNSFENVVNATADSSVCWAYAMGMLIASKKTRVDLSIVNCIKWWISKPVIVTSVIGMFLKDVDGILFF